MEKRHRVHASAYPYHNAFAGCYEAILRAGSPNLLDKGSPRHDTMLSLSFEMADAAEPSI